MYTNICEPPVGIAILNSFGQFLMIRTENAFESWMDYRLEGTYYISLQN